MQASEGKTISMTRPERRHSSDKISRALFASPSTSVFASLFGVATVSIGVACARGSDGSQDDVLRAEAEDASSSAGETGTNAEPPDGETVSADAPPATSEIDADGVADAPEDVARPDTGTVAEGGLSATDGASPPADAALTCAGAEIACGGHCVDPTSDPNNCGACAVVCGTGLCGVTVAADMTAAPANWTFNGSAVWDPAGPSARMTAASAAGVAGTAIYGHPLVTDSFTASFAFRIGANGGGRYDGMGFMLETTGPSAVGAANSMLGMGNLGGYGVEFDVYDNSECGDVSDDQIGVDLLQPCMSTMPTSLYASADLTGTIDIGDAQWHTTSVQLDGGALSVSVDGHALATAVALTGFVAGTSYYFGFSGGTGGIAPNGGVQTEAKDVTITFPTPRCL
jgi:hypothetical protein